MNITEVKVRKVEAETRLKAIASITFDNDFVVNDIKIIESDKGCFIGMPCRKMSDGTYKDVAHPINAKAREEIQQAILAEYEKTK